MCVEEVSIEQVAYDDGITVVTKVMTEKGLCPSLGGKENFLGSHIGAAI